MIYLQNNNDKIEIIHLDVRSDNINAIKLHKEMDFCEIGHIKSSLKLMESMQMKY
jgi:ribosomal protein S18 acetylase RimI-like enzyme